MTEHLSLGNLRAMRITSVRLVLLTIWFAAALHGQQDAKDLLANVSGKVIESVDRLPRYVCTQTIEFAGATPGYVVPVGMESSWVTETR